MEITHCTLPFIFFLLSVCFVMIGHRDIGNSLDIMVHLIMIVMMVNVDNYKKNGDDGDAPDDNMIIVMVIV